MECNDKGWTSSGRQIYAISVPYFRTLLDLYPHRTMPIGWIVGAPVSPSSSERGSAGKTNLPLGADLADDRPLIIAQRKIAASLLDYVCGKDSYAGHYTGEDKKAAIENAHRCHLPRLLRSIVTNTA